MRYVLVVVVAACANRHPTPADGAPSHGLVTVTITDIETTHQRLANHPVVFVDTNGAQVVNTDANGMARADVEAGASVSTFEVAPTEDLVLTIFDAKPGDVLMLGQPPPDYTTAPFTVTFTPLSGSSISYYVDTPCDHAFTTTGSATLMVEAACAHSPLEVLVVATDGQTIVGSIDQLVTFTPGGSATLGAPSTPVPNLTATLTDLTSGLYAVSMVRRAGTFGFGDGLMSPASIVMLESPAPLATSPFVRVGAGGQSIGWQQIDTGVAGDDTAFALSGTSSFLPWIAPPTFDPVSRTVDVSTSTMGTTSDPPDLFLSVVNYPGATLPEITWYAFAAAPGTLTMPPIPPEIADVTAKSGGSGTFEAMESIENDALDGYNAARLDPFAAWTAWDITHRGRVRYSWPTTVRLTRQAPTPQKPGLAATVGVDEAQASSR